MKIKICGNKSLQNINEVYELNPDMMGFIFYAESPRYVNVKELKHTISNLSKVKKVGVFVNASIAEIKEIVFDLKLDMVQLHGDESAIYCIELRKTIPVIKALNGNESDLSEQVKSYENVVDYFLIDNKDVNYGGSGIKFNASNLSNIKFNRPFMVAGGIGIDDIKFIDSFKSIPNFYGIDLNSRFEIAPGEKNIDLLKTFINTINNEA